MRRTALAVAGLAAVLAACGQESPGGSPEPPSPSVVDELSRHDGEPCPARLPDGDAGAPAPGPPDLPAVERAWVCRYEVGSWTLAGEPRAVSSSGLATLEGLLGRLEPAPADQMCTMDLGPRYLLVLARGGDLTGVLVDAYGCRNVRLTDDPHTTPAGTTDGGGLVQGVLTGPGLLDELVKVAG